MGQGGAGKLASGGFEVLAVAVSDQVDAKYDKFNWSPPDESETRRFRSVPATLMAAHTTIGCNKI